MVDQDDLPTYEEWELDLNDKDRFPRVHYLRYVEWTDFEFNGQFIADFDPAETWVKCSVIPFEQGGRWTVSLTVEAIENLAGDDPSNNLGQLIDETDRFETATDALNQIDAYITRMNSRIS